MPPICNLINPIIQTVRQAGQAVLKIYFSATLEHHKSDGSPVTKADLLAQKIIIQQLAQYGWPVLSEEKQDNLNRLKKEKIWIVDPLDGTRDFLQKTGNFSIMIGLADKQKPVLGIVYQPTTDKIYFACQGQGAFLKEKNQPAQILSVSTTSKFKQAQFIFSKNHFSQAEQQFVKKNNIKNITYKGSTGLKICTIAQGKSDVYLTFTNKTKQWDTCAPHIITEEAGGIITDLKGNKIIYNQRQLNNPNGILACSSAKLHQKIINILNTKKYD